MERLYGLVGYRAKKLPDLEAISRSIILGSTGMLRENNQESYRSFPRQTNEICQLKMEWSGKTKNRFKMKIEAKHAVGLANEETGLTALEELKKVGGPFTNADEIDAFFI